MTPNNLWQVLCLWDRFIIIPLEGDENDDDVHNSLASDDAPRQLLNRLEEMNTTYIYLKKQRDQLVDLLEQSSEKKSRPILPSSPFAIRN